MSERAAARSGSRSGAGSGTRSGARAFACDVWLPLLLPSLAGPLAAAPSLAELPPLASRLPGTVLGAFEVRLSPGPEAGPVDLSIRLATPREACAVVEAIEPPPLRQFLRRWAERQDPRLPFVWLEIDLAGAPPAAGPMPPISPIPPLRPVFIVRVDGRPDPAWLIEELIPEVCGEVTPAQRVGVERAFAALRPPGSLAYLFNLRSRGSRALRLSFTGLPPAAMAAHLVDLGRPDLAAAIAGPVELIAAAAPERFELSYDLDEEVLPRVGIEASFPGWTGDGSPWPGLLARLVDAGLCSPAQRAAALGWSGYDSARRRPDVWPAAAVGEEGFLVRWLSHVKLVCRPGLPPEAKLYLLFGYHVRTPGGRVVLGEDRSQRREGSRDRPASPAAARQGQGPARPRSSGST